MERILDGHDAYVEHDSVYETPEPESNVVGVSFNQKEQKASA